MYYTSTDYVEALEHGFYTKNALGDTIMVKKEKGNICIYFKHSGEWLFFDFITDTEALCAFENRI